MQYLDRSTHPQKLLIFNHIPKTAGTSLGEIIKKQYGNEAIYRCYGDDPQNRSIDRIIKDLSLILQSPSGQNIAAVTGHLGFGLHEFFPELNYQYLTILREPVDRVISYYSHVKRYFQNPLGEAARNLSIEEFISRKLSIEIDNLQTRYLSGIGWQKFILGVGEHIPYGQCSTTMLALAKDNLDRDYLICIQENFPASLAKLSDTLQWQNITNIRVNVNDLRTLKTELSQEAIDLIKSHNQLDLELYNYARLLFDCDGN
jgi:Sulfotransferase family